MVFIWVSQHQSIKSNEMDDEYPVIGSSLNETSTCYDIQTPFVNIAKLQLDSLQSTTVVHYECFGF